MISLFDPRSLLPPSKRIARPQFTNYLGTPIQALPHLVIQQLAVKQHLKVGATRFCQVPTDYSLQYLPKDLLCGPEPWQSQGPGHPVRHRHHVETLATGPSNKVAHCAIETMHIKYQDVKCSFTGVNLIGLSVSSANVKGVHRDTTNPSQVDRHVLKRAKIAACTSSDA